MHFQWDSNSLLLLVSTVVMHCTKCCLINVSATSVLYICTNQGCRYYYFHNYHSLCLSGSGFFTVVSVCFSWCLSNPSMFWMVFSWVITSKQTDKDQHQKPTKHKCHLLVNTKWTCYTTIWIGVCGLWNPTKMPDIGFLKTNLTDRKIQKPKTQFPQFGFQKTDFGSLETVCHTVSFTVHLPTWYDQQSKYFYSCHISALLLLSHFGWQLVGPIQHRSTSFLASYHRGASERFFIAVNPFRSPK